MKHTLGYTFAFIGLAAATLMAGACSKMDDYKEKYVSAGEITYTGKMDSVTIYSGKNRVKFKGLLNPDPRVTSYKVYWGGRADSATFSVTSGMTGSTIEQIVPNIPEGEQTFEFVTFDASGNKSISTFQNGTAYGALYEQSLSNRTITASALDANLRTSLTLISMDTATNAFITEIRYKKENGDSATTLVPLATLDTFLVDHQYGSLVKFRTWFKPTRTSIDTFYTPYNTYQPVSGATWINVAATIVKNPGNPFQRASWDGSRWGILADWTSNADVKNTSSGNGGYELRGGVGVLSFEAGWGLPAVPNGKIYQVVHLPYAGKWRFINNTSDLGSAGTKYMAVNMGTTMPDYSQITTASYYYDFSTVAAGASPYIEFTISAPTDVCIGFVCTMPNTGSYLKIKSVGLSFYKE